MRKKFLKMSVLLIGDPHFKKNNQRDTDILMSDIMAIIEQRDISFVVILGDVMDNHANVDIPVFRRVHQLIAQISSFKPLFILIGNHDRINNKDFMTDIHAFNAYKMWPNVVIVDVPTITEWNDKKICLVPFVPDGRYMEALEYYDIDPMNFDLFFSHQEFNGCLTNKQTGSKCDSWQSDFPLNISGHIHENEIVSHNLIYIGTPFQQNFGESTNKALYLLSDDDGFSLEPISINVPVKVTRTINYTEIDTIKISETERLKLTIIGPIAEVRQLVANNAEKFKDVKIMFKDPTKEKVFKSQFQPMLSFRDRFFQALSQDLKMKSVFENLKKL